MLDNMKKGDKIDEEGTMEELKNACESSLPKIKNMLKEEEDSEKLELLNEVKTIIKGVILKYQDVKHGNYDTEYDISGKFKSESFSNAPPQAISLIDLDDEVNNLSDSPSPSPPPAGSKQQQHPMDELSDIFGVKANVTHTTNTGADPFDLLSHSIQTNTLPASPNLSKTCSSSSSPIMISSPKPDTVQKSSKLSSCV